MNGKNILESMVETAKDLKLDKVTIRELETLAIPPIKQLSPTQIKKIRKQANASQAVMARLLNVGITTVQKWERGDTVPSGAALKLLNIAKNKGIDAIL